jgi:hypothetical protein
MCPCASVHVDAGMCAVVTCWYMAGGSAGGVWGKARSRVFALPRALQVALPPPLPPLIPLAHLS